MNSTVNGSNYSSPLNPSADIVATSLFYCLIFVVSLVGNSFIIIIVFKTQAMRTPVNFFIVNMATSDLLFPVFLLPILLKELFLDSWPVSGLLGLALCKLAYFLADISSVVSVESLVLIAVDRFGAVVYPFRPSLISSKLCPFFIFGTWIFAMAFISPCLIVLKLVEYPGKLECKARGNEAFGESWSVYLLAHIVLIFCIPITLMAILYSIILIKLKSQKTPGEQSVNAERQRAKRNANVLKMAIAIVFGFALCFVPMSIILLLSHFSSDVELPRYSSTVVLLLARANCAINPCICFIFSGNYRQGLKKILKCSGS